MVVFDVPDKLEHEKVALLRTSNSGILITIRKNSLPDLDDRNFDIQPAMATAKESRGTQREKRTYAGQGGR